MSLLSFPSVNWAVLLLGQSAFTFWHRAQLVSCFSNCLLKAGIDGYRKSNIVSFIGHWWSNNCFEQFTYSGLRMLPDVTDVTQYVLTDIYRVAEDRSVTLTFYH